MIGGLNQRKLAFGDIQSNLNGSNSFGTMKICSRYGLFEPLRVNQSARSESKWR